MPVNLPFIQPLSFEQNTPGLQGYAQGQQIGANNLAQALQAAQLPYVQPSAQASVQQQQLANALTQARLPFAPQQAQAQVGLTQGQANLANAQANYFPFTARAGYLGAVAKLASGQAAADRAALAYYQTNEGQNAIRNNPQDAQAFSDIMARQRAGAQGGILGGSNGFGLGMPTVQNNNAGAPSSLGNVGSPSPLQHNLANALDPSQVNNQPNLANLSYNAPALFKPNVTAAPVNLSQNNNLSPEAATIQQGANDRYLRQNLAPGALKQIMYGNVLDTMLKGVQPQLADISLFSGAAGQANQTASKYAQAAGLANSPQYKNFKDFVDIKAPLLANEIRRVMGGNPSDKENAMLADITNPTSWDKSPQQTYMELNTLINTTKGILPQLSKTPTQIINSANQNAQVSAFDPASYYNEMQSSPKFAKAMYQLLPPDQRAALKAYHQRQRGSYGTS